ncbi:hypothetical protein KI387_005865, partial [Taxus chinensis]
VTFRHASTSPPLPPELTRRVYVGCKRKRTRPLMLFETLSYTICGDITVRPTPQQLRDPSTMRSPPSMGNRNKNTSSLARVTKTPCDILTHVMIWIENG